MVIAVLFVVSLKQFSLYEKAASAQFSVTHVLSPFGKIFFDGFHVKYISLYTDFSDQKELKSAEFIIFSDKEQTPC